MVAVLAIAGVVVLVLGAAVGWAVRGQVSRWCPVHGEPLICATRRPHPAVARAAVRWQAQPAAGTSTRPLMTRAAENRASRINQRRSI